MWCGKLICLDMEVTVNVYLAAINKIKISNTVNSTFASALLCHILSLFIQSCVMVRME